MRLTSQQVNKPNYPERILQFGEGNFLRAFADWAINEMNKEKDFNSSVVVVQPIENGLINMLNEQDGLYTLYLQGIQKGEAKRYHEVMTAISRGINPYEDFASYLETAKNEDMRFVISNTTEAGIAYNPEDTFSAHTPSSYPAKLTRWLFHRWEHFNGDSSKGMILLPCELIEKNGEKLKEIILSYAKDWDLCKDFSKWIEESNTFCNTLVDRIVTGHPRDKMDDITKELGYDDSLVVEGELFHLWVIEGPQWVKDEFPVPGHLNIKFVDDLTPYRSRKVRILNGAHTSMVPTSYLYGLRTVRESLEDEVVSKYIRHTVFNEIIPTLTLPKDELQAFAEDVIERFLNPYIKHYLSSIALNSISKYKTRVLPSLLVHLKKNEESKGLTLALAALLSFYKGEFNGEATPIKDDEKVVAFIQEAWSKGSEEMVNTVLAKTDFWGEDLTTYNGFPELVKSYVDIIQTKGMAEAFTEVC